MVSSRMLSSVSDLGSEIADTEKQEFREDLKERKAVLLGILSRLGRIIPQRPT